MSQERICRLIKPGDSYDGRQGLTYFGGISAESTGAQGICARTDPNEQESIVLRPDPEPQNLTAKMIAMEYLHP